MSTTIEDRVVQLDFDGSGLESGAKEAISVLGRLEDALRFDGAAAGIENVKQAMSSFDASPAVRGVDTIKESFSAVNTFVNGVIVGWGKQFADFTTNVARKLYRGITAPVSDGFREYELLMKSVQTISANSGESLEVIQQNLDELNEYADKTIYVFSDMTSAIGRFTAAGLGVEESTKAIKGFFNAAALSGTDAQSASRGIYQLSQAMSAGVVRLQDWKSIENASVDTESFRKIIMLTAEQMGVTNDKFKAFQSGSMSFRESLSGNWLTAEVMQKALENLTMSTMDFEDAEAGAAELMEQLVSQGYGEKQAKEIIEIATAADQSAREIRTWSQLMDTVLESMGSGWANTWMLLIGDYNQSAEFFTWLSNKFDGVISASSNARNQLLSDWQEHGGRDALIGIIANSIEAIERTVSPVIDALGEVFKITGEQLAIVTENIAYFTEGLVIGGEEMSFINSVFFDMFSVVRSLVGVFGNAVRVIWSFGTNLVKFLSPGFEVLASLFAYVAGGAAKFANGLHVMSDSLEEVFSNFFSDFFGPLESIVRFSFGWFSDLREAFLLALPETEFGKLLNKIKNRIESFLESIGLLDKLKSGLDKITTPFKVISDLLSQVNTDGRVEHFKQMFLDAAKAIETRFSPAANGVKMGLQGIGNIIGPVIGAFKKFFGLLGSIKLGDFSGIADLLSSGLSSVLTTMSSLKLPSFGSIFDSVFGSSDALESFINGRFLENGSFSGVFNNSSWKEIVNAGLATKDFQNTLIETAKSMGITGEGFEQLLSGSTSFANSLSDGWLTAEVMSKALESVSTEALNASGSLVGFASTLTSNVRDKVLDLRDRFLELVTNADLSTESIKNFVIQLGQKVRTKGSGVITTVVTTLSSAFSKLISYARSFKGKNLNLSQIISTVFSDVYHAMRRWLDSIVEKSEGFGAVLAGLASTILDKVAGIPSLLTEWFGLAKASTEDGLNGLSDSAEEFKNNAETFWTGLFEKLPSLSDIGELISNFVGEIKKSFLGEVENELDGDLLQKASVFDVFFNLSRFSWVLPDWKTPVENFLTDFASVLDLVPDDRINELVETFVGWAKKIGSIAFAFSGWKFLGSLTRLNNAKAGQIGALGDLMEALGKAPTNMEGAFAKLGKDFAQGFFVPLKEGLLGIGTAIRDFGKYFDPLGKKSKGRQFMQVAEGILMLAGALFILSKVPADDLERAGMALLKIGAASAILMLVIGVFVALGKMDLSGVGAAFGGLGLGLLAMSAALYVLCNLLSNPDINIEDAYIKLLELMGALTLAVAVIGLATKNSSMAGAAASLIALALAITLSLVPLYILAITPDALFSDGVWKMGLLMGTLALLAMGVSAVANVGSAAGAAVLLALVTAVTLAIIPLLILSQVPEEMYQDGFRRMLVIGGVLVLLAAAMASIGLLGPGILVGIPALLALIAALTLAVIPIFLLGSIPTETLKKGLLAVAGISLILALFGAAMGAIGTFLPGILIGSAALIIMDIAIGLIAVVVSGLAIVAALNPDAFATALIGLIAIAVSFAVLAGALSVVGPMIAVASVALIGMVVAVGLMAALVVALAYLMDLHPEAMVAGVTALATIVAILAGIGIAGAVSGVGFVILAAGITAISISLLALSGAIAVLKSVVDFSFLNGLFESFSYAGNNIGAGLQAGISNSLGGIIDAIGSIGTGIYEWICGFFQMHSPSALMEEAGGNVVQGLINGITGGEDGAFDASQLLGEGSINGLLEGFGLHMDDVENLGTEGSSSFLDQFSNLPSQLGEKANAALEAFLAEFNTEELEQKGADLIAGLINGVMDNLGQKMSDAASGVFHGFTDPILEFFGIKSPSTYMRDTVGSNIIQGLLDGLSDFGNLGEVLSNLGFAIIDGVSSLPEEVGEIGRNVINFFAGGMDKNSGFAKSKSKGVADNAASGFNGLGASLKLKAETAMTQFGGAISGAIGSVTAKAGDVLRAVADKFDSLRNTLKTKASNAMAGFASGFSSGGASAAAQGVVNAVGNSISTKSLYDTFVGIGKNAVQGLIDGINAKKREAEQTAKAIATIVSNATKKGFDSHSPSKVFKQIGEYVVEGLVIGINSMRGDAADSAEALAEAVPLGFAEGLSSMSVDIDDLLDTDYNPVITPVINSTEFDSNLQQLSNLMNSRLTDSLSVGNLNYNETFAGKLDALADTNRHAMEQMVRNSIDYDRLGISVANALIASGVHVEMDGGQVMGYIAGEIRDIRRMFGQR